jgi:hypothetical protein
MRRRCGSTAAAVESANELAPRCRWQRDVAGRWASALLDDQVGVRVAVRPFALVAPPTHLPPRMRHLVCW